MKPNNHDEERKTRSDSILRNLTQARRDEIGTMMMPGPGNKSYAEIQKLLAEDGIKVSQQSLSKFYSYWWLQQRHKRMELTAETIVELVGAKQNLTAEEKFKYGQDVFSTLAIADGDREAWADMQRLDLQKRTAETKAAFKRQEIDLKQEGLKLSTAKFQRETCELFLKWYTDKQVRQIMSSDESNDSKTEQLGQRMFGEDWK